VGGLATSPLLSRGSPTLQSGGQNQKWARVWAVWLHHPCCLGGSQMLPITLAISGGPKCSKAWDKIRNGPACGPFGYITCVVSGVPNAPSGAQNQKWAHMRRALVTSSVLSRGFPLLHRRGQNKNRAHMWAVWLHYPCFSGSPLLLSRGTTS
jgi:hypothetical protein